jgi:hypothetical protein
MRVLLALLVGAVLAVAGMVAAFRFLPQAGAWLPSLSATSGETVVQTTLAAVRREQKLLVFAAWVTADVTSSVQKTFMEMTVPGTSIRQTWIVPGLVRYAIDLSTLEAKDLAWNEKTRTLTVRMPPVVPLEPAVQLDRMKVFSEKGLLAPATDVEEVAEQMNREAIAREIMAQAKAPELMRLAEEAAAEALRNSFLLPLNAAGIQNVQVEIERPAGTAAPAR